MALNPATKTRGRLPLRRRLLFALVPLSAMLLLAEVTLRIVRAPTWFGSFRALRLDMMRRNYPAVLDDTLGYAPQPGYRSSDNHWRTRVSIDADGLRTNGDAPHPDGRPIVCVGDSFTFGDQVDDDATWPAQLERALGRPVLNGGVFGYSLTQIVLRGERLLDARRPAVLVVAMIADDLLRSTYSRRYTNLPWFDFDGDGLVLKGVPIDHTALPPDPARWWKDLLGCSALLDGLLASTAREWYYENDKQIVIPHLYERMVPLGRRLVDRIAKSCREHDARLLLVLQGGWRPDWMTPVLEHAAQRGVETLDLAQRFLTLAAADPSLHTRWFAGHMTEAGNAWVAEQIAERLRD